MSDGIKGAVAEAARDVAEAVVKPVADEFGQAIEQGVQAVSGKGQNQQNQQSQINDTQKKVEDQKKIADAQRRIQWWRQIEAQQNSLRNQKKQGEMIKKQDDNQKDRVKQFEIVQKKQSLATAVRQAQTKTEVKRGVGG